MLRQVILTNFIHFQDEEKFDFQPGCTFFIGENCSGKSSVFEAARRCLSLRQNTSMSRPHFPDQLSSAVCIFDITDDNGRVGKLLSANIRLPDNDQKGDTVYIKAVYEDINNTLGIDLVKETNSNLLVNEEQMHVGNISSIKECINKFLLSEESQWKGTASAFIKLVADYVSENVEAFKGNTEINEINCDTEFESILHRYLDDFTVFTFPIRGVGPCQWSRSQRVKNEYKKRNYESAQRRAEILHWYITEKESGNIPENDQYMVERNFNIIANHSGYTFHINKREDDKTGLVAYNTRAGKRSVGEDYSKPISIMKIPEGILEAMNSAILLGLDRFKTICLEEPERGMHPQMIDRMRDLVLRKIEEKTVIITSHHPYFLGPWTVPKLYIFKRSENKDGTSFNAYGGFLIEQTQVEKKTPRIITSEHFASVFFAKRILFVEGEAEYIFMTTMKQLLLEDDQLVQNLEQVDIQGLERFRMFLCSLQIVSMSGETFKLKFYKLCSVLAIEKYFLLDYDAIVDSKETAKSFLEDFGLTKYCSEKVLEDVSNLEDEGLFVWNKVKIEDVLIDLGKRHHLEDFYKDNNVTLKFNPDAKMNKRYKLFRHKDLTDEHITAIVGRVLHHCLADKHGEMYRLLRFLNKKSKAIFNGEHE